MGHTWVLSAPDGPHVGPMNLAVRVCIQISRCTSAMRCVVTSYELNVSCTCNSYELHMKFNNNFTIIFYEMTLHIKFINVISMKYFNCIRIM